MIVPTSDGPANPDLPSILPASPQTLEEVVWLAFTGMAEEIAAENRAMFLGDPSPADAGGSPTAGALSVRSTEGLWEARRGGRLVGAIAGQLQAGRVGALWPPRLVAREPLATAQQLLNAACDRLAARGAAIAHVILERASRGDAMLLRACDFRPMATLLYLMCSEGDMPTERPAGPLEFEPFDPNQRDRLAQLVEATYADTLDCPMLNGLRNMEDTLTGYESAGVFDSRRWLIVRHQQREVGCLLLTDHPQHDNWELVYMGLLPSARGNRWGQAVVRHAQWLTRQAGRQRLVLAVDAANHPAVTMYTDVGFRTFGRRRVYLKTL
jgi:mycothiol synthase